MANYANFKRGDFGLFAHCERKKDENGKYVTFGNERIDSSRSHLNYNLCTDSRSQTEIFDARFNDPNVKCQNRPDVNVYGSWCVTLPTHAPTFDEDGNMITEEKEVHHKDGTITTEIVPVLKEVFYDDEQTKEFFRLCYEFLKNRYGEENVISAYVHMDETTPHMHFLFLPIIEDTKWNEKHPDKPPRKKICAKQLMNKTELNMFHRVLQEYLDEHSEKDLYPMLNGTTIGGNRTIAEMKAEEALGQAIEAAHQANATRKQAEEDIAKAEAEAFKVQKETGDFINLLYQREADAEKEVLKEFNAWAEAETIKERPAVQEIKNSLADLGATPEHIQPLSQFADSLNNPITNKAGKTFVEVPSPKIMIPLLKKVVQKMLGAFEWARGAQAKVARRVEETRASLKAKLPQKKREADLQNQQRWAAERQARQEQQLPAKKKKEQSL